MDGPLLLTVMVYVPFCPAVKLPVCVLVTPMSADAESVAVSVDELLFGLGSVMPAGGAIYAVLTIDPVAPFDTVALIVYVSVPFAKMFAVVLILPLPPAQLDPLDAVQAQVTLVKLTGNVSVIVALVIALGPALVTTNV